MTDLRQPAYDAVYAYLAANPDIPRDLVTRNAIIWRAVHTALDAMGAPHRQLIAQLEADRTRMLAAVDNTPEDEAREEPCLVQDGMASGCLHAIVWTLQLFEGSEARQTYLREHADGKHLTWSDGPSVVECAADDRAYWEHKDAREGQ